MCLSLTIKLCCACCEFKTFSTYLTFLSLLSLFCIKMLKISLIGLLNPQMPAKDYKDPEPLGLVALPECALFTGDCRERCHQGKLSTWRCPWWCRGWTSAWSGQRTCQEPIFSSPGGYQRSCSGWWCSETTAARPSSSDVNTASWWSPTQRHRSLLDECATKCSLINLKWCWDKGKAEFTIGKRSSRNCHVSSNEKHWDL